MSDVTRLLDAVAAGDRKAAADLLPLVYDELRKLAAARMAGESAGHTLQATALVHEAYLRLVGRGDDQRWDGRGHFFAAAAEAMRRILIESARRKHGPKRGGDFTRHDLDPDQPASTDAHPRLLALDKALDRLAAIEPRAAEVVKLRYFAGLTIADAAAALGISPRTADNDWAYARAWLVTALRDAD
jgi:RNA polymerase sigma factor (TIGR02999 family)